MHPNTDPAKALPLDRKPVEAFEWGFKEPEHVSKGRTTLRQAIEFIGKHQHEPNDWTVERIADEYKLKESVVCKFKESSVVSG